MNNLSIRKAKLSDAKSLLLIRNQKHVRNKSINTELIQFSQHIKWYKKFLDNSNNYIFLLEVNLKYSENIIIGYCRYNLLINVF